MSNFESKFYFLAVFFQQFEYKSVQKANKIHNSSFLLFYKSIF